ncbi:MAG: HAD family phosphatase [Patescibacteria group bacterium]
MSYQGILFDLDGVLLDSEAAIEVIFRKILKEIGDFNLTPELYRKYFLGRSDNEGFAAFHEDYPDIPVHLVDSHKEPAYRGLIGDKIVLYPGALDVIKKAQQVGRLALVTGSARWQVEALEKIVPFGKYFSVITTVEEVTRAKPDPEIYQITLKKMNLPASACLAIEDTPYGVRSAKSAGLTCWAVEHNVPREALREADKIFPAIRDLTFNESA